jgi:hypothetical protein
MDIRKTSRDEFLAEIFSRLFADPNNEVYNNTLRVLLDDFVSVYEE